MPSETLDEKNCLCWFSIRIPITMIASIATLLDIHRRHPCESPCTGPIP